MQQQTRIIDLKPAVAHENKSVFAQNDQNSFGLLFLTLPIPLIVLFPYGRNASAVLFYEDV